VVTRVRRNAELFRVCLGLFDLQVADGRERNAIDFLDGAAMVAGDAATADKGDFQGDWVLNGWFG